MNVIEILNEGIMLKRQGKYEEAKEKYLEAIRLDKTEEKSYYNLGKILYILGDYEASANSYKIAFDLGVDARNVLIHLGHSLLDEENRNGKYKNVICEYEEGVDPYKRRERIFSKEIDRRVIEINRNRSKHMRLTEEYKDLCIKTAKKYLDI